MILILILVHIKITQISKNKMLSHNQVKYSTITINKNLIYKCNNTKQSINHQENLLK